MSVNLFALVCKQAPPQKQQAKQAFTFKKQQHFPFLKVPLSSAHSNRRIAARRHHLGKRPVRDSHPLCLLRLPKSKILHFDTCQFKYRSNQMDKLKLVGQVILIRGNRCHNQLCMQQIYCERNIHSFYNSNVRWIISSSLDLLIRIIH